MMRRIFQILFIISVFVPVAFLVMLSLGRNWAFPNILPESMSINNWFVFADSESQMWQLFLLSVGISLSVAAFVTFTAFLVSKSISYSRHKTLFLLLAYIPYLLSPVILGVIFQYYFLVANLTSTIPGVMIAQVLMTYPFAIIIFSNFWTEKVQAYEMLGKTLGANSFQTFRKILLPISKRSIALCFFQIFLVSWFEYGLTKVIGGGKVRTLTVAVFKFINEANIFYAALACCLLVLPPMIMLYLNKRMVFFVENQE